MGGEYRLVTEEEWQNLHDALDHESRMREMESEAARRWQEIAEGRSGRNPFEWAYSDDPAGFNECRCDEPKPAGHWTSDREWEADPAPCGCDPDSRILCDRHFREDFCESDPEPCDGCAVDYVYASPQRPHESLVWAIYHAALAASPRDRNGRTPAEHADEALVAWRDRWPEDEA